MQYNNKIVTKQMFDGNECKKIGAKLLGQLGCYGY